MSGRQPLQVASVVIDEGLHLVMMPRYDVLSCRGQRRLRQQQARHLWGRQVRRRSEASLPRRQYTGHIGAKPASETLSHGFMIFAARRRAH